MRKKLVAYLRSFWRFFWCEESLLSYLVFIVVFFLLLKFIIYPGLLWLLGFKDIVAVLSASMVHNSFTQENFWNWLEKNNFTREEIESWPFLGGLNVGDAVTVVAVSPEEIKVGDVIVFIKPGTKEMIIHRVIARHEGGYYTTKGDANPKVLRFEQRVPYQVIIGKARHRVPLLGYPRVLLARLLGI
jgi:signal peptidase I